MAIPLDPISAALDIGSKLIEHFFPDPTQKAAAYLELTKLQQAGDLAIVGYQSDVNKVEAANPNLFIAGWRPAIGWICGFGLGMQFVVAPFATWGAVLAGHPIVFPTLDLGTLTTLLFGLLGLGSMRTIEKLNGAAGNH